jgi:hypothetical protein
MSRILATYRPHIICELFPESWIHRDVGSELEAILAPQNYNFYLLTDQGLQHCPHITGAPEPPLHSARPRPPGRCPRSVRLRLVLQGMS